MSLSVYSSIKARSGEWVAGRAETSVRTVQKAPGKLPVLLDEDIAKELPEMQSKNINIIDLLREFMKSPKMCQRQGSR